MGRPPTSGYCHTCRKRRIKCDKARPACQRCIKSGYACKGYELGLRMQSLVVVTEPEGRQRLAKMSSLPNIKASSTALVHQVLPPAKNHHTTDADGGTSGGLSGSSIGNLTRGDGPSGGRNSPGRLGRELPPVAFQEQMAFSYFFATYDWAGFWKPFLQLSQEIDMAEASHAGALALAYGHMGRGNSSAALRSRGLELYGQSMRAVQRTLAQSGPGPKTAIARLAVPVIVLAMYSYAVDKDLRLLHHLGVAQILQHCGPESFQSEPLLTVYRTCRAQLICQAFAYRHRTVMEEERWSTVPFLRHGKTLQDRAWDFLAVLPGVVHDMAAAERPVSPATKLFFARRVRQLKAGIHRWRWEWARANPAAARALPSQQKAGVRTPAFRKLLATSIELETATQALELLAYNAGLTYMMQLEDVLGIGDRPGGADLSAEDLEAVMTATARHPDDPLLLPGEARFAIQPALEALRLVPFLRKHLLSSDDRVMVALAPVGIVYCALRAHPELSRCMADSIVSDMTFLREASRELVMYEIARGGDWVL